MKRAGEGFTVKNLLGIILTVIGLSIFLFGVARLYTASLSEEDENARKTLERIMAKIEVLPLDVESSITLQGFKGADSWVLMGWNGEIHQDLKPQKCFFGTCLCICKGASARECQERGFCRSVSVPSLSVSALFGEYVPIGGSSAGPGGVEYEWVSTSKACIVLNEQLGEITLLKTSSSLTLTGKNLGALRNCLGAEGTR